MDSPTLEQTSEEEIDSKEIGRITCRLLGGHMFSETDPNSDEPTSPEMRYIAVDNDKGEYQCRTCGEWLNIGAGFRWEQ